VAGPAFRPPGGAGISSAAGWLAMNLAAAATSATVLSAFPSSRRSPGNPALRAPRRPGRSRLSARAAG